MNFKDYARAQMEKIYDAIDKNRYLLAGMMIIGVILTMEGFIFIYSTLNHWFSHLPLWALFIILFIGIGDLSLVFLYTKNRGFEGYPSEKNEMAPYLEKLDRYIHISNRYVSITIGAVIIFFVWFHNFAGVLSNNRVIGDADILLLITGFMFIMYTFIPSKYHLERDFITTFFVFLMLLMGILPYLFDMYAGFKYYFLTLPVHHMLDLVGIPNRVLTYNRIAFPHEGRWETIIIARSCSGIYSFSIFTSAFISFALVVYRKFGIKITLFLIFGIFLAYIGNIIRMTMVIASGHYYGVQTMMWVHETIGYVIFFVWMSFFWLILYKFLMKDEKKQVV